MTKLERLRKAYIKTLEDWVEVRLANHKKWLAYDDARDNYNDYILINKEK
jgi:hypothetical protein